MAEWPKAKVPGVKRKRKIPAALRLQGFFFDYKHVQGERLTRNRQKIR